MVLWWFGRTRRLPMRARAAIESADTIAISTVSAWEVATLVRLGRVRLDRPVARWFQAVLDQDRVTAVAVDTSVALRAGSIAAEALPGDPADRIIVATAVEHRATLVTADRRLRDHGRASESFAVAW